MTRTVKKKKTGGGFLKALFLLALGATGGLGGAALIAAYVNDLPIPFIESPTRVPTSPRSLDKKDGGREAVEFHEVLRKPSAPAAIPEGEVLDGEETPPQQETARKFVHYLQIGAYRNQESAQQLRGQLILAGWTPVINEGQLADGGILYRVWIGPYESEDEAESNRAKLALAGYAQVALFKTAE